jgi:DNA-binding LytR/AlgR family response regulator
MKVVIIEDETLAARRLEGLVKQYDPAIEVVTTLTSIKNAIKWFAANPQPDLLFMDIHLEDGLSFSIFEQVEINTPVIFTTAFDDYMLKAFKVNSVDYLLKPINREELSQALDKFKKFNQPDDKAGRTDELKNLLAQVLRKEPAYKSRFVINAGSKIKTIDIEEVAYFYSEEKLTFLVTTTNLRYPIDYTLEKLMESLDPMEFFRVNRKCIVKIKAIDGIHKYSASRLKLTLLPPPEMEVFVSTERYGDFKEWLNR